MAAAPGCLQVADRWASMAAAEILKAAEARTSISIAFLNNFTVSGLKSPTLRVLTRTEAVRVSNLLTSLTAITTRLYLILEPALE